MARLNALTAVGRTLRPSKGVSTPLPSLLCTFNGRPSPSPLGPPLSHNMSFLTSPLYPNGVTTPASMIGRVRWSSTYEPRSVTSSPKAGEVVFDLLNASTLSQLPSSSSRLTGNDTLTLRLDRDEEGSLLTVKAPLGKGVTADEANEFLSETVKQAAESVEVYAEEGLVGIKARFNSDYTSKAFRFGADGSVPACVESAAKQFSNFSRFKVATEATEEGAAVIASSRTYEPQNAASKRRFNQLMGSSVAASEYDLSKPPQAQSQLNFHPTSIPSIVRFPLLFASDFIYVAVFMVRTMVQFMRPFIAFSIMGEVMKLVSIIVTAGGAPAVFVFSFLLAFEVFYLFIQCYVGWLFATMFFSSVF